MALAKYKQKRSFDTTPEPLGGKSKDKQLHFVIQKHDASHLHYDFRLELTGVLKSWAVPKGPSTDPEVKRLAMMVEDHPYDYKDFEGIIPEGNYGAGSVIVWDEGTYEPIEKAEGKAAREKLLLKELKTGSLKFILKGKKLKGEYALVKTKGMGDNAWLLIKHRDKYAKKTEITKKTKSILSGKTVEQVAARPAKEWISNRAKKIPEKRKASEREQAASVIGERIEELLQKGKKAAMPKGLKPMLATLTEKAFDRKDWIYEIKWDGYRALAYLDKGWVSLQSRNQLSFNHKFSVIADALKSWNVRAVTDGEIVALDDSGKPDFQMLQQFLKSGKKAHLVYYIFDLLWYEGRDLKQLPLSERKEVLKAILPADTETLSYCDHVPAKGRKFFGVATARGFEGVIAKAANSEYTPGRRSTDWLKIKNNKRTEAIICGFTEGRGGRSHFGAAILGKYEGATLQYIGHTGGGFTEAMRKELSKKMKPLIRKRSPFATKPKTNMPATWLKPQLVCEVKFAEMTEEGILRQPVFLGLREDKTAKEEQKEKTVAPPAATKKRPVRKKAVKSRSGASEKTPMGKKRTESSRTSAAEALIPVKGKEARVSVDGRELKFTNLDKLYWPEEGITKRDMLNYYNAIASVMLPWLKDRPQSLNRFPDGISRPGFYQKNVEGKVADWIETFPYHSESENETLQFLVCKDKATLLYMANLGCIEINPWHSRIQKPDYPDYCLIDLDPDKSNSFNQVIETALVLKDILDDLGLSAYVKTSGSSGIHILLPLGAKYSYDQSRMLAELVASLAHKQLPEWTSLERSPAKRKGKIYLDYLQNRQIQTMAVAYSLRPKPGATASAPLHWEEVKKGLKMADFNINTMRERVRQEGDLFKGLLGKGINLNKALTALQRLS